MSGNEFTPGPWTVGEDPKNVVTEAVSPHNGFRAMVADCYTGNDEQAKANARLIAAAPAMLEALQRIDSVILTSLTFDYEVGEADKNLHDDIQKAINSALGTEGGEN